MVIAAFNIKKDEAGVAIADGEIKILVQRKFFDHELLERRAKRDGQIVAVEGVDLGWEKGHRARLCATQLVVKNQNREERVGCDRKIKCCSLSSGTDSVQPIDIELHRNVAALDNHFLKRVGADVRSFLFGLRCIISRAVPEEQQQQGEDSTGHI